MIVIDACGLSCPEPIMRLRDKIGESDEITIKVDNQTSVEGCSRYAKSQGCSVEVIEENDIYKLIIRR